MKNQNNALYDRVKSMVITDKFGALPQGFTERLSGLLAEYFVYDGLQVHTELGAENNVLLCVCRSSVRVLSERRQPDNLAAICRAILQQIRPTFWSNRFYDFYVTKPT